MYCTNYMKKILMTTYLINKNDFEQFQKEKGKEGKGFKTGKKKLKKNLVRIF